MAKIPQVPFGILTRAEGAFGTVIPDNISNEQIFLRYRYLAGKRSSPLPCIGRLPYEKAPLAYRVFSVAVHMCFAEALAQLGGEASDVIAEKADERLIVGKLQLGGDLLDVFIGVAEQLLGAVDQKAVDQLAHADPICSFTNAGDVIGGIAEMLGNLADRCAREGVDACPFVDAFGFFVEFAKLTVRQM